jgi:bifunctional DNA-binding transcriptional regulator/antitoxin component of YhaV-PrlF toxin-antitoxin module
VLTLELQTLKTFLLAYLQIYPMLKPMEYRPVSPQNQICLPAPYLAAIGAKPKTPVLLRVTCDKSKKKIHLELVE